MKSKLQLELMSDGESEVGSVLPENPSTAVPKYERFDGESTAKRFLAPFLSTCWGREMGCWADSYESLRPGGWAQVKRVQMKIFLPQL